MLYCTIIIKITGNIKLYAHYIYKNNNQTIIKYARQLRIPKRYSIQALRESMYALNIYADAYTGYTKTHLFQIAFLPESVLLLPLTDIWIDLV